MSYEGEVEYLCEEGHYYKQNVNKPAAYQQHCSVCRKRWVYFHDIDHTNGFYSNLPYTFPAGKKVIGHTDIWNADHHGNMYAIKIDRYGPANSVDSETGADLGRAWEECQ